MFAGSCNDDQTVMVKMSSSYHISLTSEDRNTLLYCLGGPDHTTYHHYTLIYFSFIRRFVEADFKKYCFVLNYLIGDSLDQQEMI